MSSSASGQGEGQRSFTESQIPTIPNNVHSNDSDSDEDPVAKYGQDNLLDTDPLGDISNGFAEP